MTHFPCYLNQTKQKAVTTINSPSSLPSPITSKINLHQLESMAIFLASHTGKVVNAKCLFNWIPCLGAQLWSRGDKRTVMCLSYAADSYSWLSLSLLSWCLNLFRLTQSAKCQYIQVTFSMFYFPLDLDWSPCSVLNLSPPRCRLSIPCRLLLRPPKVPSTQKRCM